MKEFCKSRLAASTLLGAVSMLLVAAEPLAQLEPKLSLTNTADAVTVSATQEIGFTMTIRASASGGSASGVWLQAYLPPGDGIGWYLASGHPAGCIIGNAPPTQSLSCPPRGLAPGASVSVRVVSRTSLRSCKTYSMTASVEATNAPSSAASASVTVQCPSLTLTKTADAASVEPGLPIGFTITASNGTAAGTGSALAVRIVDALPRTIAAPWSIDPPVPGCALYPADTQQTLRCDNFTLAPGQSISIHVRTVPTPYGLASAQCAEYENVATLDLDTLPQLSAYARTSIRCPGSPVFTSTKGAQFTADENNSFIVVAAGTPAAAYQVSGPLPPGTTFDGTTGELRGKPDPASVGLWQLTFTAQNGVAPTATQTFSLFVGNPRCSMDVDGDGSILALSDGLLLIRAMFGLTGTAVTNGAVAANALRNNWAGIRNFLNGRCGTSFSP